MGRLKVLFFTLFAVCTVATFVPRADAQVKIVVGHGHRRHHHRHAYYRHGHRYYR